MGKYDAERQALTGGAPTGGASKYANERSRLQDDAPKTYSYVDTTPLWDNAPEPAAPVETAPPTISPPSEPSFLQKLGQSLDPSKAWQGVKQLAGNAVTNPIEDVKQGAQAVSQGIDYFENATGLDKIRGAVQGALSANLQPDVQPQDGSYMGMYKNLFDNAGQALQSVAGGAVAGFQNPADTRQHFDEKLNQATANMDPVARFGLSAEAGAATDPLTYLPLEAPLLGASKVLGKIGGLSDLRGAVKGADGGAAAAISDSKYAQERAQLTPTETPQAQKYDAEREQIQPSTAAGETGPVADQTQELKPANSNLMQNLFGESNGVGITPFGSTKSNRMVSTEQQIVNNPLRSNVRSLLDSGKQVAKTGYQNTVDMLSPLKQINKATYDTAMDASRANNLANTIIHDKFVDNEGNVVGNSLDDIMKASRGLGKKLDNYLILRHAITRMERGERVYDDALKMTPDKAKNLVEAAAAKYPGLKKIGDAWDKFNTNLLDSGVREGLITQEARDAMREANPNYASMRRQFTLGEKLNQPKFGGSGSAFSGQNAPIKSVSPTGSTRKIVSPIRSAIEQVYAWKNAELRNRTMQEIVKAIQLNPERMQGIAEIVKKPSTSYKSLDEALRNGGSEEFLQQLDNDFKSLFKPANPGEENIVRAMVNGQPVFVRVHNVDAVKALLGLGAEQSGIILGALQKLSNATKRGATGLLAPMFAVKNLTADTVQAAIQSPNAIKHLTIDAPYALISSMADVFHIPGLRNLAVEFRRAGGEYSGLLRGDRQLNKSVYDMRRVAPLSMQGVAKGAVMGVKAPFKALEKAADVAENVNRMAAYRRDILGKEKTPENVRSAINAARESTVNFSRKGAWARETEAFIPYNNAAIQSITRMARNFSNPKTALKTLAAAGTLVVAPKLYEFAKFGNDPDYQNLPARERYRNLIHSKNADGTFNKLPMPPEYEAFAALMTDVLRHVVNKDPQAFNGSLDALANAYTPPAVSGALQGATQGGGLDKSLAGFANATVAAPYAALMSNQSFTGAPIESKAVADRSPANRFDDKTSAVAKAIGEKTGWSPMKVDYLIRSYGGDPARLLLPLTSNVGGGNVKQTLLKNYIVDPQYTNTLTNDYYSLKEKVTQARADAKEVNKPLPSWYSEDLYKTLTSTANGSLSKQLQDLSAQKNKYNADKNMNTDQKAKSLRDIQAQINDIYLTINSQLKSAGVPD